LGIWGDFTLDWACGNQAASIFHDSGYQNANVSKVSSLSYLGIFMPCFLVSFFFEETFGAMSYVGMGLFSRDFNWNLKGKVRSIINS